MWTILNKFKIGAVIGLPPRKRFVTCSWLLNDGKVHRRRFDYTDEAECFKKQMAEAHGLTVVIH